MAKEKFKVKADKEKIPGYDSELEIEVDDKYEAYFKGNIPDPTQYTDESGTITVTWFNNFGVREKKSKKDENVEYTVRLNKLPAGKMLFVMYDGTTHKIQATDDDNNKSKFTLSVGDPPVGSGP
jgi:hypothetical protein